MALATANAVIHSESLESQIRECYARVVYSHKIQEKASDIALSWLEKIKWAEIILSAITTTAILAVVFTNTKSVEIVSVIASTILLGLIIYQKDIDLNGLALKHASAASQLWKIRESYLSLLVDMQDKQYSREDARLRRNKLEESLGEIYAASPRTNDRAYKRARQALRFGEEMTFSAGEIDLLLPESLRTKE